MAVKGHTRSDWLSIYNKNKILQVADLYHPNYRSSKWEKLNTHKLEKGVEGWE